MTSTLPVVPKQVLLSAIMYNVTVAEEMVIFSNSQSYFNGKNGRFAFERKCNCWYLLPIECESLMVSHITKAYELIQEWFGKSFEGKRGEYHL